MINTDDFTIRYITELDREKPGSRRSEFVRYYNHKRIKHQTKQLDMLRDVPVSSLTEIGPYLGYATALFMAAGFRVQTIDVGPVESLGEIRPDNHITKNVLDVTPDDLAGRDVIVCCETLEHLYVDQAKAVMNVFRDSGVAWLLLSVPFRCASFDIRWSRSPFSSARSFVFKLPTKRLKRFEPQGPKGHKWELGYKGYPLAFFTDLISDAGYEIHAIDHVPAVQSVMALCRRTSSAAAP